MVKTRHEIAEVAWRSKRARADVEVLRLRELAPRTDPTRVGRVEFHLLVLYLEGTCAHEVDFETHRCKPGTLIRVAPGQVHRFLLGADVDGLALIFQPTVLFVERARAPLFGARFFDDAAWPTALSLRGGALEAARAWLERIEAIARDDETRAIVAATLRLAVAAALLDVARVAGLDPAQGQGAPGERDLARAFRDDVERSFRVTRRALDYAERLRCSERTLDRASRAAFGATAKRAIDARVILEAKRLLAHTSSSVAVIGDELGFSEPTNFVKFFRARAGESPGDFRARTRGDDRARAPGRV